MTVWILLFMTLKPGNRLERRYFDAAFFSRASCVEQGRMDVELLKVMDSFECRPVEIKEDLLVDVARYSHGR